MITYPVCRFGHSGFVIYWMLSWMGMCALGLAVEAMLTFLTVRFIPIFLVLWIICESIYIRVCTRWHMSLTPFVTQQMFPWHSSLFNSSRAYTSTATHSLSGTSQEPSGQLYLIPEINVRAVLTLVFSPLLTCWKHLFSGTQLRCPHRLGCSFMLYDRDLPTLYPPENHL